MFHVWLFNNSYTSSVNKLLYNRVCRYRQRWRSRRPHFWNRVCEWHHGWYLIQFHSTPSISPQTSKHLLGQRGLYCVCIHHINTLVLLQHLTAESITTKCAFLALRSVYIQILTAFWFTMYSVSNNGRYFVYSSYHIMFVFQHLLISTYFGNIFTMVMLETDYYVTDHIFTSY